MDKYKLNNDMLIKIWDKIKDDPKPIYPNINHVLDCFRYTPYEKLDVIFLGQDPYPQKDIATGLAFANDVNIDKVSPSLEVLMYKVYDEYYQHKLEIECNNIEEFRPFFDITLKKWAIQGVLLLNSSLTVAENSIGSHSEHWFPFIRDVIKDLSYRNEGLIYVLLGNQAQYFRKFIKKGTVINCKHPAYYARKSINMQENIFSEVNSILKKQYNREIIW